MLYFNTNVGATLIRIQIGPEPSTGAAWPSGGTWRSGPETSSGRLS